MSPQRALRIGLAALLVLGAAAAQTAPASGPAAAPAGPGPGMSVVSGRVVVVGAAGKDDRGAAGAAVWLLPLDPAAARAAADSLAALVAAPRARPTMEQRNKTFIPHLLVVPMGAEVAFPNRDPFFHNVFSLYNGRRFDLGLYEAGSTRSVRFNRPGVSYIFCNIHEQMSAVIVVVPTPYFARTTNSGAWRIAGVPAGRYTLRVWWERGAPASLAAQRPVIEVAGAASAAPLLRVEANAGFTLAHKNKYGQDYVPAPTTYGPE